MQLSPGIALVLHLDLVDLEERLSRNLVTGIIAHIISGALLELLSFCSSLIETQYRESST